MLGAVCRPVQLYLETCTVLLIVLQEMPATASLPNGLAFLAAIILADTQYSEILAGQCANVPVGGDHA